MSKKKPEETQVDETLDEATEVNEVTEEVAAQEEVQDAPSELEVLQARVRELEDQYLRANADFENMRKRLEKEKMQAIGYAHEQFARDLLPVIDALEIAATSGASGDVSGDEMVVKIKEGIELTIEQFKKCFEKHGVSAVNVAGEFDPNVHEAVMQLESDAVEKGHIVQVLQKGYTIKDRVLRPAMVSIAK